MKARKRTKTRKTRRKRKMAKYDITPEGKITEEGNPIGWAEGGTELRFNEGVEVSGQARGYLQRKLETPAAEEEPEGQEEVGQTVLKVFSEEEARQKEEPPMPHAREI